MNSEVLLASLLGASRAGIKLTHERVQALLAALGNPHHALPPTIHIAGTNGKGSTTAYLRAMYEAQGLRVHGYTSPHLVRFHERIVLAGEEISENYLCALLARLQPLFAAHDVTYFEAITVLALVAFHEVPADVVLLEVGLGGRLDVTNVIPQKIAAVITPIAMDHMEFLGNSLAYIAAEKAAIMLPKTPAIIAPQAPEAENKIREMAEKMQVPALFYGADWSVTSDKKNMHVTLAESTISLPLPSLAGEHQIANAALAVVTALTCKTVLSIAATSLTALAHAKWPARLQQLHNGPLCDAWQGKGEVLLDGGHNAHAAQAIAAYLRHKAPTGIILGMMARKDARAFLSALAPYADWLIAVPVESGEGECMQPAELVGIARELGIEAAIEAESLEDAAKLLPNCHPATLLITGSLYLAGEILKKHG